MRRCRIRHRFAARTAPLRRRHGSASSIGRSSRRTRCDRRGVSRVSPFTVPGDGQRRSGKCRSARLNGPKTTVATACAPAPSRRHAGASPARSGRRDDSAQRSGAVRVGMETFCAAGAITRNDPPRASLSGTRTARVRHARGPAVVLEEYEPPAPRAADVRRVIGYGMSARLHSPRPRAGPRATRR